MDTTTASNKIERLSEEEPKVSSVEEVKTEARPGSQSKGFCRKVEKEISLDMSRVDLGVVDTPCVPKSSSRFLQDWRRLRTVVNRCYKIDCNSLVVQLPLQLMVYFVFDQVEILAPIPRGGLQGCLQE